jgi:hypothetical protein
LTSPRLATPHSRFACLGSVFDQSQNLANLDVFAFFALDAGEHSRPLGTHFKIDFVGLELDHDLAYTYRVAFLLEPTTYGSLNHGLAQFRHDDLRGHTTSELGVWDSGLGFFVHQSRTAKSESHFATKLSSYLPRGEGHIIKKNSPFPRRGGTHRGGWVRAWSLPPYVTVA